MYFSDPNLSWNKSHALAITRKWVRLAPLPVPDEQVHVVTRGSGFTRTFVVTFTAKPEVILAWLKASPGTEQAFGTHQTLEDQEVEIMPGGGAMHAEITISEHGTKVVIETYWS